MGVDVRAADSYESAMEIVSGLAALDGPNVNPACQTRVYSHGARTERSLVLLHGFTNCPAQFDELGRRFFDRGWNVLIPRYPRHGYIGGRDATQAELRSEHLIALANRAAEAGAGLGERLSVCGISLGGVLAGYIAQTRPGVERAVLVAPALGVKALPGPALAAVTELAALAPNFYVPWSRRAGDAPVASHVYPRFSTHALAALTRTARQLMTLARREAPLARSLVVITNAAEPRIDNREAHRLVSSWRRHGAEVETFEFGAVEHLPHDLIDPAGNAPEVIERSYPVVRRFLEGRSWPEPSHTPPPAHPPAPAAAARSARSRTSRKPASRPRSPRRPKA